MKIRLIPQVSAFRPLRTAKVRYRGQTLFTGKAGVKTGGAVQIFTVLRWQVSPVQNRLFQNFRHKAYAAADNQIRLIKQKPLPKIGCVVPGGLKDFRILGAASAAGFSRLTKLTRLTDGFAPPQKERGDIPRLLE